MTKLYIIVGETSGDYIGSKIIEEMKLLQSGIEISGIGGENMLSKGLPKSLFPMNEINIMGFFEILPHIFRLQKLINKTVEDILTYKPDILITIDAPGFTYRVASKIRKKLSTLKMIHIVAPSVWAYKPGRALKYAKIYNHLLTLLPFEPPYFEKFGLKSTYIGHPFLEQNFHENKLELRTKSGINESVKVVVITPGSRKVEIIRHLPIFIEAIEKINHKIDKLQIIFTLAQKEHEEIIYSYLKNANFKFEISYDKLESFAIADCAIAKSGTNTLEIAASKTPLIVAYKLHPFTFWLLKKMIKIRYASLINIIADKEIIPEFIQDNCSSEKLSTSLIALLTDKEKQQEQIQEVAKIINLMGFKSTRIPTKIASKIINHLLAGRN